MKNDIIDFLSNKEILILGYGREGRSAFNFIKANIHDAAVTIADQKPLEQNSELADTPQIVTDNLLALIPDYDIVIKSPGIPVKEELSSESLAKITSITDLFMRFCKNPIIGITGTKGKSTTSSLIYHILHENHRDAILAGNIGKPCFDIIDDINPGTTIVLELSCHQLEFIQAGPHVALLLNLYEEHLDHYRSPNGYFDAKKNIYRHLSEQDLLIYGDIFQHASRPEIDALPCQKYNIFKDTNLTPDDVETTLVGKHNFYNICAAIKACEFACGLSETDCISAIKSFRGLPHRMEFIGKYQDILFYNDSIATAQEAVIQACESLPKTDTLILGGMDRGLNYHPLVEYLRTSTIRNIILLPATQDSFARIFNEAPYSQNLIPVNNLEQAVQIAYQVTAKDHICILSPAAASYGFYKNFEARGDHFRELVQKYSQN